MKILKSQIIKLIKEQIKDVKTDDYYKHLFRLWSKFKSENIPYNIQDKLSFNRDKEGIYIYVNQNEFDTAKNEIKKFLLDNKIKSKLIKKKSEYMPGLKRYTGDFYEYRIPDKEVVITFK